MEAELTCPVCNQIFIEPVLLPCFHSVCFHCAVKEQKPIEEYNLKENSGNSRTISFSDSSVSESSSLPTPNECSDFDKQSVLSETDSGVICSGSRPSSYAAPVNCTGITSHSNKKFSLRCPTCQRNVYLDDAQNLPKYRAMQNVIDRCVSKSVPKCHLCVTDPPADATVFCEQCEVLYCENCLGKCHPSRGPLAKHTLTDATLEKSSSLKKKHNCCQEHPEELLSLYCTVCSTSACMLCSRETVHLDHEMQPVNHVFKLRKLELSQFLQQLSNDARTSTDALCQLKNVNTIIDEHCVEFEGQIVAQIDALIEALNQKKEELVNMARRQRDLKKAIINDQVSSGGLKLQQITGFFQFCFELLKEPDPVAFLQIGSALVGRLSSLQTNWNKEINVLPEVSAQFCLSLDEKSVMKAIEKLSFLELREPNAPRMIPEQCCTENNTVTVAWQKPPSSHVEGYVLELDDGCNGEFREVYCGKKTMCTVDGLQFGCIYNARVKAYNKSGEGRYSELIGLQTSDVAWFVFEPYLSAPGIQFSSDNTTVTCKGFEHRVALGNIAFTNGIHYWQYSIDKFDTDTDPSFGVATIDVSKDTMLGKDNKGWGMYIDSQRSWFVHNGVHENRHDGGISVGYTVGVLLDLVKHQLSFYVNDEPQGPVAFRNLHGEFYPAVSINRGVTVTLHTSLDPPSDVEDL